MAKTEHYCSPVSFPCLPSFFLLAVESLLFIVLLDNGLALELHADTVKSVTLAFHDEEEVNDVGIPDSPSTDNIGRSAFKGESRETRFYPCRQWLKSLMEKRKCFGKVAKSHFDCYICD